MAKIQFSGLVREIRGRFNGSQFSVTSGGAVLQNKCVQRIGATAAQSNRRSSFSNVSRFWRTISSTDKTANNANALNYPYIDKFGNVRFLTGYQLLLRSNINRALLNLSPISVVPAIPPVIPIVAANQYLYVLEGGTDFTLGASYSFDSTSPLEYSVVLYVGNPVSNGVNRYNGVYIIGATVPLINGAISVSGSQWNFWQAQTAGTRVFMKLLVIHNNSGIVTNKLQGFADYTFE